MSGPQSPATVRTGSAEAAGGTVSTADLVGTDLAGTADLGPRAARTRMRILAASRELFLEHGYAGTRIGQITAACAISRAGFYTYFRDKQEIFNALGVAAYRAVLNTVEAWDELPSQGGDRPVSREDLADWVAGYFAIMDEHGPFIFSASQSAPTDEQTQADAHRMQMRTAWALGTRIQARQRVPTDTPDTLGLAALALLDRSWFFSRPANLPVSDREMVRTVADWLAALLGPAE
ncbi:MAG TPA: TetR/AcrR family transcriptional regulator [Streptosporangiaceae bacterium]|jgi:TetR/AcrR family transcriptional regulator